MTHDPASTSKGSPSALGSSAERGSVPRLQSILLPQADGLAEDMGAGREKQGCQAHSQEPRGLVPLWSQGQPYVLGRTSRRPTGAPEHSGIPLPHQSRRPLGPQTAEGAPGAFQPFLLRTAPIGETYSTRPAPVQPGEHRFKFWPTGSDAPK